MKYLKYTFFLLVILIVNCESKTPPLEYFPDMYDSPAVEAQEADPFVKGKYGSRIPPEGTIPVGYFPYIYKSIIPANGLPGGGLAMPDTIKKDLATYKRGEDRYQVYCAPCHGVRGEQNGSVVGPYPRFSALPASLVKDKVLNYTDGQIYHVITMGAGQMKNYASQIESDDRWKIVLYIRKLQEAHKKSAMNQPNQEKIAGK